MSDLVICKDPGGTEELLQLDFGRVEAGTSAVITAYVKNAGKYPIRKIAFEVPGNDGSVRIASSPVSLEPGAIEPLIISWSPPKMSMSPLGIMVGVQGSMEVG